jgi:2-polyprenyl-3-methyl-5-hydroxy-6-metoxy-1,4-benzoquinol methylase
MLLCPECKSPLLKETLRYSCRQCGRSFADKEGIIQFTDEIADKDQYYPDTAFEILYSAEEKNFWFKVRNKIIGNAITRYLPPHSRILEVGCGTGYVSRFLKDRGYRIECADLFLKALQFCKERQSGDFYYQYNLSDQLFIEEFDGICAFDVMEHIDDDLSILKNLYAALKPGGVLFLTVPADRRLWSAMDMYAKHKRRYSRQELQKKVEGNGFKVIKMSYFMALLYPFVLFSRKFSCRIIKTNEEDMKKKIKNEVVSELQPGALINSLGFLIFSLEVPLIRWLTIPYGSSLLCVAVKES